MSGFNGKTQRSRQHLMPSHDAAVLRAVGVVILIAVGAMHFLQIVPTFEATPALGVAYVGLIGACLAAASGLVAAPGRTTWVAAGAVCAAALAGYAFTRVLNTPFDNQDVGNWACMLGLAAVFTEGVMVAVSGYAVATDREGAAPTILVPSPRPVPYRYGAGPRTRPSDTRSDACT